jgi:hypothetical protein
VADHLGLDLDLVELLARVDTDDAADHLGDNDHVTEVGLDEIGLLVGPGLLLGLAELLDETHGLALKTAVEPSAGTGVDEIAELLRAKVEEPGRTLVSKLPTCIRRERYRRVREDVLVKVDTTVRELAERSLPLKLCAVFCQPRFLQVIVCVLVATTMSNFILEFSTQRVRSIAGSVCVEVIVGEVRAYRQPPRRSVSLLATVEHLFEQCCTHVFGISHGCGSRSS